MAVLVINFIVGSVAAGGWTWAEEGVCWDTIKEDMKKICDSFKVACPDGFVDGEWKENKFWKKSKPTTAHGEVAGYKLKEGKFLTHDGKSIKIKVQCPSGTGGDNAFGGKNMKGMHIVVTEWENSECIRC